MLKKSFLVSQDTISSRCKVPRVKDFSPTHLGVGMYSQKLGKA